MVKHYLFFLVTFITFFLDRITKYFATDVDITSFFSLNLVKNYGVGFGLFQHQFLIIVLVSIGVIGAIGYYYNKIPELTYVNVAVALILGGTLGNLFDRLYYGYVIDFLDFKIWPVFNVADTALVIGVGLLIIYFWE